MSKFVVVYECTKILVKWQELLYNFGESTAYLIYVFNLSFQSLICQKLSIWEINQESVRELFIKTKIWWKEL